MNESKITTAIGKEGLGDQSWWVEQWMQLITSYRYKKRLERAWIYAREGNVSSIHFKGQTVYAKVQGTDTEPYKVKLWLDILEEEDWEYVIDALAKKAKWSALLLAGIMPKDIEKAFASTGKRLFPFSLQEVKSECNCPDQANPCKHISAIYYLMGDQFKENPFILFQLRGKDKNTLLSDLVKKRISINERMNKELRTIECNLRENYQKNNGHDNTNHYYSYTKTLDDDLVVITSTDIETYGLTKAGELPLAKNPKFPKAHETFIQNIISHAQTKGQEAMLNAMSIEN